ncbi:MAG: sensor domain-containing diguanylate cyclase [Burkholderiaceae bacterium]
MNDTTAYMKQKWIRRSLIALLLIVQAATMMVVLRGMSQQATSQLTNNAQVSLERLADSVAYQADRFLAPAEASVQVASRLVADGILNAANDRELESYFLAELTARPSIKGLFVGRADGSFLFVNRNAEGLVTKSIDVYGRKKTIMLTQRSANLNYLRSWVSPQDTYDPRARPWYRKARDQAGLVWTSAYTFFSAGAPGISAAMPLRYPDGSDAGVLGVDVEIRDISAFIAQVPTTESGKAVLIDQNQNVVGFSDFATLTARLAKDSLPAVSAVVGAPLQALAARIPANLGNARFESFELDEQAYLGLIRPLSLLDGRVNWTMLVQMPSSEYFGVLDTLFANKLRTLLAVFGLIIVIALLGYFGLSDPKDRILGDARIDPLTGALTRSEFERRLQGMLRGRRELESGSRLFVVALDLDGFKSLNDEHGEEIGDVLLAKFVRRLRRRMRHVDLIGRNGGDEFILAARFDRRVDVTETINRIRREVVDETFRTAAGLHQLGVTAGIAGFDEEEGLDSLISRANQALVTGKARGRNRCYMAPDHHARWPETAVSVISAQFAARRSPERTAQADSTVDGPTL